jgi:hypothetical protein
MQIILTITAPEIESVPERLEIQTQVREQPQDKISAVLSRTGRGEGALCVRAHLHLLPSHSELIYAAGLRRL